MEVLTEDVSSRVEFGGVAPTGELMLSATAAPLFLLVVTAAPFKLFIRAEALLLGVAVRFLGALASADVSPAVGLALELRLAAVLMLSCGDAEVEPPDAASVVTDAPCDRGPPLLVALAQAAEVVGGSPKAEEAPSEGEVTALSVLASLEFISWSISGLLRRPCCCCSSVVVLTGAGSGFPK